MPRTKTKPEAPLIGIKDVEEMVGKKAYDVLVHEREVILIFSGGRNGDDSPAGDVRFHIKKW